jgi:hypothetical protein
MSEEIPAVGDLLNAQTARIGWDELARHFARGVLVRVDAPKDLLHVAELIVRDNTRSLEPLFTSGVVSRADDEDARRWARLKPEFWAVVVAPWVLVQEIAD